MPNSLRCGILLFALFCAAGGADGAEFDIDSGRVVLRQMQYCVECGSALLVTGVQPGMLVRCPDCGREQSRIAHEHAMTRIYQLCRLCHGPLNPSGHSPGDVVECGNCRTRQTLDRDAFAAIPAGPGYAPGFPPGTGAKTLLLARKRGDLPVLTPSIDNDAVSNEPPAANDAVALTIPRPPATVGQPPLPDLPASSSRPAHDQNTAAIPQPEPRASAGAAMEVPAVTADLFGGRRDSETLQVDRDAMASSGIAAALVDGAPIYRRDVDRVLEPVVQRLRLRTDITPEQIAAQERALRREVLERLIDRELVLREAAAIGYRPDPSAVREREAELRRLLPDGSGHRREAERDVTMSDMRRRYAEKPGAASPQAVREYYNAHKDSMLQPRLIALDQLVIYEDRVGRSDARSHHVIAQEVSRELEQGRRFDELRERYDEFAAAAGIPRPEPALQPEAAYARQILASAGDLRRGAVFGPLFMPGMALFGKVADERPAGPAPFEEVEREIRTRLENEATERSLDAWLKRLRQKTNIQVMVD